MVPWAVLLVNQNRASDVLHVKVLEAEVGGTALVSIRPCLDPNTILGVLEGTVSNGDALDGSFIEVFSETSDANAVARSAGDSLDSQVLGSVANGDAVVAGLNVRIGDADVGRSPYVNTVGVVAVFRGYDFEVSE